MSRRNRNKNKEVQSFPGVDTAPAPVEPEETVTEPEIPVAEEQPADSVESVVAQALEAPAPEPPPPVKEEPPAATVKQYHVPPKKVMSEDLLLGAKLSPMQKCVMSQSQLHTPPGLKLLDMFKEYEAAMSVRTTDRAEHAKISTHHVTHLDGRVHWTFPDSPRAERNCVLALFRQILEKRERIAAHGHRLSHNRIWRYRA